jgi:hypothetical protein
MMAERNKLGRLTFFKEDALEKRILVSQHQTFFSGSAVRRL